MKFLQTGRELISLLESATSARGLLALGGIDFGELEHGAGPAEHGQGTSWRADGIGISDPTTANVRAAREVGTFRPLPASAAEVADVALFYRLARPEEPAEVWTGSDAREDRLKSMERPPAVLHLATHGFFLSNPDGAVERPLLFSGVALAGANRAMSGAARSAESLAVTDGRQAGPDEDGLLHALEALDLRLDGTELVILSACETGRGVVDYSEGVYGLVRAIRIAGAERVLMTLWPVDDGRAREFMAAFYQNWLGREGHDPGEALRLTKLAYIARAADRRTWAPFILVDGKPVAHEDERGNAG